MPLPKFKWVNGAYRTSNGTIVPQKMVETQVRRLIDAQVKRVSRLSDALKAGDLTLAQWEAEMMRVIKQSYVSASLAADGTGLTRRVQDELNKQAHWLDQFARDIKSGKQSLDGRFAARARMYPKSAWNLYQEMRRNQLRELGYTEERRVLHPADHCAGCLREAEKGWQPIGTLSPIGTLDCLHECKCTFEFRKRGPTVAESAPTPTVTPSAPINVERLLYRDVLDILKRRKPLAVG